MGRKECSLRFGVMVVHRLVVAERKMEIMAYD